MRKTILTYGLFSGGALSAMMAATVPFMDRLGSLGAVVGYTTMVLAFLLVYFGVRSYRDSMAGGVISFGRAFRVGLGIAGIACCCYVATWEVIYYGLVPDFGEKYAAQVMNRARASGASEAELARQQAELDRFVVMYRNPLANIAFTFLEPLPVGVLMTLLSAGMLRRRPPESAA